MPAARPFPRSSASTSIATGCVSSILLLMLLGETGVDVLEGADSTAGARRSGLFVVERRVRDFAVVDELA